jgi:hypothetical protein
MSAANTSAPSASTSHLRADAYEAMKIALRLFSAAAESAPVPGGQAAADGLLQILQIVEVCRSCHRFSTKSSLASTLLDNALQQ